MIEIEIVEVLTPISIDVNQANEVVDIVIEQTTETIAIEIIEGRDGADGLSAYQIAVLNGFVGTEEEWLLSLVGAKGDTGDSGILNFSTNGDSGESTYDSGTKTLNVPNYSLEGLGGEPAITAGTVEQYWRGDKTWQTFPSISDLQQVTDIGNTTTNDIQLIDNAETIYGAGGGILLDNSSRLREGTINAGLGGSKGIAQICAVGYELKWEAGRLYVMDGNGIYIRWSLYNFNISPTINDDITQGYTVGSLWGLDNNSFYLCTDNTEGAAVWTLQVANVPTLQEVTDAGNTTSNDIIIEGANDFVGQISSQVITAFNNITGAYAELFVSTKGQLTLSDGTSAGILSINNLTNANVQLEFPNKTTGNYTIATTADIPATQIQSDWNQSNNSALDFIKNKPNIPAGGLPSGGTTGQILTKVDSTDYNATWQENYADWTSVVKHTVKNDGTSLITKGTAVYVTGSNGTNMLVGKASNASEATSSKTMGLMESNITTTGSTQTGFVITEGLLGNLNTATATAGDPVWLGVNGALIYGLLNKPYAPAHLVFIGIVTKVSSGNGEIFVKVQNGFELKEIHDVDIITTTPINGHLLGFDGTLWVNKTVASWLGFTPVTNARTISTTSPLSGGGDLTTNRTIAIAKATASVDGYLSSTDWSTFNSKIGGSGTATRLAFYDSASTITSDSLLVWENTSKWLGIGITPIMKLQVSSSASSATLPVAQLLRPNGTGASNKAIGYPYLLIGGAGEAATLNVMTSIGFGYNYSNIYFPFVEIGSQTTSTSGNCKGDFWIATRTGTTNVAATERIRVLSSGETGFGTSAPTAIVHIKAGTATASTAPLKLTAGTNLTTPENGAIEFDGTNIFITIAGTRKTFVLS